MSEQPVDRAAPAEVSPADAQPEQGSGAAERSATVDAWALAGLRRRPRVVVKADLLPAVSIASTVALIGLAVCWIWSRIAPPERVGVSTNGQILPLLDESYHRFDDLAIFLLVGFGAGLVTGAGAWLLRERRGPTVMFGVVVGSVLAAWLAYQTGVSFAAGHYPPPTQPGIGSVFYRAPRLESGWALLAEPLGVLLAYGVLAAWNGMQDLGRRLS